MGTGARPPRPAHASGVLRPPWLGALQHLPGPFDLAQLTEDAIAVVNALDAEVVLVGHSMGGKVAQLVAARNLSAVTGLVLVAPAPPEPPSTITPQFQRQLAHAYDSPETVASAVDHVLTANPLTAALRAAVIDDSLACATAARTEWPLHGIAEDITTAARHISVDTVVVAGSKDLVEPVDVLREHLEPFISAARTHVVIESGHLIPLKHRRHLPTNWSATEPISVHGVRLHLPRGCALRLLLN